MNKFKDILDIVAKSFAVLVPVSYGVGFFIWMIFLQSLGFSPNFFQARFVLTGVFTIVMAIVFSGLCLFLYLIIKKIFDCFGWKNKVLLNKEKDFQATLSFSIRGTVIACSVLLFALFIFPRSHAYMGGAKPKLVSLVGDEQMVQYLKKFGIASSSDVQTGLLCSPYEDDNYIVLILTDRILSLKKDMFKGFATLPNKDESSYIKECNGVITTNVMKLRKLNLFSNF